MCPPLFLVPSIHTFLHHLPSSLAIEPLTLRKVSLTRFQPFLIPRQTKRKESRLGRPEQVCPPNPPPFACGYPSRTPNQSRKKKKKETTKRVAFDSSTAGLFFFFFSCQQERTHPLFTLQSPPPRGPETKRDKRGRSHEREAGGDTLSRRVVERRQHEKKKTVSRWEKKTRALESGQGKKRGSTSLAARDDVVHYKQLGDHHRRSQRWR